MLLSVDLSMLRRAKTTQAALSNRVLPPADIWRTFAQQTAGSIAPTFGVLLLPIMLATGAAIDYSRASQFKTSLQAALDAALLAGAKDGTSNWSKVALDIFKVNIGSYVNSVASPTFSKSSAESFTGKVAGSIPTAVLGIINIQSMTVGASATAKSAESDDSCILTLDHGQPASHVSLFLNGAPIVNVSGCTIRSNTSIDCNGHDGNATKSIAAGSASGCLRPRANAPTVPDLYAALATNITRVCSSTPGVTWTPGALPVGPGIIAVSKGTHTEYHICGNLTLSGSGNLTGSSPSSDSVIVIENGSLTLANGSTITAERTTFVLTGDNSYPSKVNFPMGNGHSATLNLSASTTAGNPWQGVALYQDPKLTYQVDNKWGPGATLNADGLVYLGKSNVVTDGNTGSSNAKCTKFVMNSFLTNGAVNLNLAQSAGACSALGLKQWGGIIVHLSR
jgi:Flp pilus assembly protein TadG